MPLTPETIEKNIEDIFNLYDRFGSADYIGEPVSQIEHMSQSAALAIREGYDDEVVLAAFFHDIGHLCVATHDSNSMGGYGVKRHEQIGADYLRAKGFSERVARLVENHVQAKRYLTYRHPEYYDALSEASKQTLVHQGGKMTEAEALEFETDPLFEPSIRMRQWDELAKEINTPIINLADLRLRAARLLTNTEK